MPANPSKDALRALVRERRRAMPTAESTSQDAARDQLLLDALGPGPGAVAAYLSRPGEPGTLSLVATLADLGWRVLLPVVAGGASAPDWAWFTDAASIVPAHGGIPQPTSERRGAGALAGVDVVLAPCLAVGRDGSRLGTGGGWYDRALAHRRPGVQVWALARERELVDAVPAEGHDVPVDAVVTESRFLALPVR